MRPKTPVHRVTVTTGLVHRPCTVAKVHPVHHRAPSVHCACTVVHRVNRARRAPCAPCVLRHGDSARSTAARSAAMVPISILGPLGGPRLSRGLQDPDPSLRTIRNFSFSFSQKEIK